ncbi:MAG: IS982 family transposase, partial [Chlamydiota bacterium]
WKNLEHLFSEIPRSSFGNGYNHSLQDLLEISKNILLNFLAELVRNTGYNRFVELMPRTIFPLFCLLHAQLKTCSGVSFIDSTVLSVCHIRRASSHKTFKGIAAKGKTSTGWFYGLKLHLVINEKGELLSFQLTSGNLHDIKPLEEITKKLFGYLFGDKGYLSSKAFKKLYEKRNQACDNNPKKYEK